MLRLIPTVVRCMNDADAMTWSRPVLAGALPCDRYSHTMSAMGSMLILFGGFSSDGYWLNDVFVLDTAFKQPFIPAAPSFGQREQSVQEQQALLTWWEPAIAGTPPSPRAAHSATVIGRCIFFFGGNDGSRLFDDLHVLDLDTMVWSQPKTLGTPPPARAGHTAVQCGPNLAVFGGQGLVFYNDFYLLHLPTLTWSQPAIAGTAPTPRAGATCNSVGGEHQRLLFFGGSFGTKVMNDIHLLDLESHTWSRPSDSGILPIPRAGHACEAIGNRLYFFGGGDIEGNVFNDLHVLDTSYAALPHSLPSNPSHQSVLFFLCSDSWAVYLTLCLSSLHGVLYSLLYPTHPS